MQYLLFYDVVTDYTERRKKFRAAHLEHARRAVERGELIWPGNSVASAGVDDGCGRGRSHARCRSWVLNGDRMKSSLTR